MANNSPSFENKPTVHYPDSVTVKRPTPLPLHTIRNNSDNASNYPPSVTDDDDDDENIYDWSGDDDLVDEDARFVQQSIGQNPARQSWSLTTFFGFLFSTLLGSLLLAAIIAVPGVLIQFLYYRKNPTSHRRFVTHTAQAWLFWVASNILVSWLLAVVVDLIPLIATACIALFWAHVSERIKSRVEMYNAVKPTIKPVFYAASAYVSWIIIFGNIYGLYNIDDPSNSPATYAFRVSQVIQFFFFLILIWRAQKLLSHFVAFSFHRTAYKERIETVEKALAVIEKLRDYRPKTRPRSSWFAWSTQGAGTPSHSVGTHTPVAGNQSQFSEKEHSTYLKGALHKLKNQRQEKRNTHDTDGDDADVENNLSENKRKTPLWKQSRRTSGLNTPEMIRHETDDSNTRYPPSNSLGSPHLSIDLDTDPTLVNAARALKNVVLHDARKIRKKRSHSGATGWNVKSALEAKHLARSLYMRFKSDRGRKYLVPADFYPAFPTHEKAESAFRVFDRDNNGDLSRGELKTTILMVYKERRILSRSMRDVGAALRTLDQIMLALAAVILIFVALSVFGVNIGSSLTSIYSLLIAASFIFKNAASSAFDAIMFLFVTHPYDTGDRCFIDSENLIVKKVGLFATEFIRQDGTQTYYFNSQLFTKFIVNVRRSDKTAENLTMQVSWRTPLSRLDALEKALNDWLATEENRWFEPNTSVSLQNIVHQRYLELTIGIPHNGNWQDWMLRNTRRTAFHAAVQHFCRELGIVGFEPPLPVVYANGGADYPVVYDNMEGWEVQAEEAAGGWRSPLPDDMLSPMMSPRGTTRQSASMLSTKPVPDTKVTIGGIDSGILSETNQEDSEIEVTPNVTEDGTKPEIPSGASALPRLGFIPPMDMQGMYRVRARKSRKGKVLMKMQPTDD